MKGRRQNKSIYRVGDRDREAEEEEEYALHDWYPAACQVHVCLACYPYMTY